MFPGLSLVPSFYFCYNPFSRLCNFLQNVLKPPERRITFMNPAMIYLDNAATSFPKPDRVAEAVHTYLTQIGANVNRGVYRTASDAEQTLYSLRERACRLFGFDHPDHVIVTPGNTFSINTVLNGFLRSGDHVLVSSLEHNAVMRPLNALSRKGISFDRIPSDPQGSLDLNSLESMIQPETRLVMISHVSNVCGVIQDICAIGSICRRHGIAFAVDAAGSAGHLPVDFKAAGLSALTVPGHKGLLGPSGTGLLLMEPAFAETVEPLMTGGTGSISDSEIQPPYMPDRFESGTLNLPGIYGLEAALSFLEETGIEAIRSKEEQLTALFLSGLQEIPGIRVPGPLNPAERTGVISVDFTGRDNAECAYLLETKYGILTRCGLHCAPSAHKALGTYPAGTVRFSVSWYTEPSDIDQALQAVSDLSR